MDPIVSSPSGTAAIRSPGGKGSNLVPPGASRRALVAAAVLFAAVAVAGITWAKWYPYGAKLTKLWGSRSWKGSSILSTGGVAARSAPSWHSAWSFAVAYGQDIWIALVAAIVIAAAMEALVPAQRVSQVLTRQSAVGGTVAASLVAVPAMMCTCCSAPLAVTLKRNGVPTASVLGFWLANPVLNPAVMAFLVLVAPWQWALTRGVVGILLVLAVPLLATRVTRAADHSAGLPPQVMHASAPFRPGRVPRRFVTAIARLAITLVPEYFVVVLLIGAFRGWLMPLGADTVHWGLLAVLVAAIAGVLIVIPTAGEIPILLGLSAVGVSPAVLGALLIALPAISLPSMAMVGRALSLRVTSFTAAAVAGFALLGGGLLFILR